MAKPELSTRDIIKALREECLKEYREYDAQFRPSSVYQAYTYAIDGDVCMKTEYVYDGLTNRVLKKKESITNWDSSWDV